ncbi:hypothetical protein [Arcicella rosea]|uniref:Membrane protein DedA with SNARE-associated domain n=1 Tax=Arcicella rosea TaxID=502909 RepID=A0A841ERT2_9BACT|nr:hypothetical protein [Arcicella rosea]MBB6003388.1 membrane protein DedA with SNARE-associated domain [Arcicella rosea]
MRKIKEFLIYIIYFTYRYYSKDNKDLDDAKIHSFFVLLMVGFLYFSPVTFYCTSTFGLSKYWDNDLFFLERRLAIGVIIVILSILSFFIYRRKKKKLQQYFVYFDNEFNEEKHKRYKKYVLSIPIGALVWFFLSMVIVGEITR